MKMTMSNLDVGDMHVVGFGEVPSFLSQIVKNRLG